MMRRGRITMECPWCKKTLEVDRDAGDPPEAVRIALQCDTCDDGDFHSPVFYAADGEQVFEKELRS